jgi:glucose/arabinose dehydrogenase
MATKTTQRRTDIDLPSWLAYLFKPILPALKKLPSRHAGGREHNPQDINVPQGYAVEVAATDFNAPVHVCFDDAGYAYVTEAGHKIDSPPRVIRVDLATGRKQIYYEVPPERWIKTGAATGACWHAGSLYFMNTDALTRIDAAGRAEDIVTGLPGHGDHQANHPVVGPDGKLYFGMGSVTNMGVVGADNAGYEWLPKFPEDHDIPAQDVVLTGHNFEFRNVLGSLTETVRTGAYVPFGTETHQGQVIKGDVKCNGAILRCNPDGSGLEVVAWGLRNPYGLAFAPDGRLFATEHGADDRGGRYVIGDLDDLYEIEPGAWYGWPDFASGIRLDDPYWGQGGQGREPVMANHPTPTPPKPFLSFEPHVGANGLAFSNSEQFGFAGDAFVALFGDLAPLTTARIAVPAGFKVVRIDLQARQIVDFAVNKQTGPASKLPHRGFERPSHCAFGPDGELYVVDFGEIDIAPERGGVRMRKGSGTLWRIRRSGGPVANRPAEATVVPFYTLQYLGWALLALGGVLLGGWLLRALIRQSKRAARWTR